MDKVDREGFLEFLQAFKKSVKEIVIDEENENYDEAIRCQEEIRKYERVIKFRKDIREVDALLASSENKGATNGQ